MVYIEFNGCIQDHGDLVAGGEGGGAVLVLHIVGQPVGVIRGLQQPGLDLVRGEPLGGEGLRRGGGVAFGSTEKGGVSGQLQGHIVGGLRDQGRDGALGLGAFDYAGGIGVVHGVHQQPAALGGLAVIVPTDVQTALIVFFKVEGGDGNGVGGDVQAGGLGHARGGDLYGVGLVVVGTLEDGDGAGNGLSLVIVVAVAADGPALYGGIRCIPANGQITVQAGDHVQIAGRDQTQYCVFDGGLAGQLGAVGGGEPEGVLLAHMQALDGYGVTGEVLHDVVLAFAGGGEHPFLRVVAADGQAHQSAALVSTQNGGHADDFRLALGGEHIGNLAGELVQAADMDLNVIQRVGTQTCEHSGLAGDLGGLGIAVGIGAGDGQQTVRDLGVQGHRQLVLASANGNAADADQVIVIVEPIGEGARRQQQDQYQRNHQRGLATAVLFHIHRGDILHYGLTDGSGTHFRIFGGLQQVLYGVQLAVQVEILLAFRGNDGEDHVVLLLRLFRGGYGAGGEADGALIQHRLTGGLGGGVLEIHADRGVGNGHGFLSKRLCGRGFLRGRCFGNGRCLRGFFRFRCGGRVHPGSVFFRNGLRFRRRFGFRGGRRDGRILRRGGLLVGGKGLAHIRGILPAVLPGGGQGAQDDGGHLLIGIPGSLKGPGGVFGDVRQYAAVVDPVEDHAQGVGVHGHVQSSHGVPGFRRAVRA